MTDMQQPTAAPATVHWAILGKHPGRAMGYEVLGTSLDEDRARRYLWGAQTGTPNVRHPEETGGRPWRIFLSGVEGERTAACAMVEQDWDGTSRDGTGAPIITSRLLLLEWPQAVGAGISWSALADAATGLRWPDPGDGPAGPLRLDLAPASPAELAAVIDDVGFDWAACVAALLTDGHRVTLTAGTRDLPTPERRVRIVDAIAALLPYGCRSWLSAANWTGEAEHWVQLTFAETARSGRTAVRYGAPTAQPTGQGAAAYLAELRRLHAKGLPTVELVTHLLAATAPLRRADGPEMLRSLREVDVVDAVLAQIREGRGRVEDVARVLRSPGLARLDPDGRRDLFVFLARVATPAGTSAGTAPRDERAVGLLHTHWPAELPRWLAAAALADPDVAHGFDQCFVWLDLLRELHGPGSAAFTGMLAAVADPDRPAAGALSRQDWVGAVAFKAQQRFGAEAEPVDLVLIRYPDCGRAWVHTAFGHGGPAPDALARLLHVAAGERLTSTTGWLRFTAYLCGVLDEHHLVRATDPADFGRGLPGECWREILDLAVRHRRPNAVSYLWASYWEVAAGPKGPELAAVLSGCAEVLEEDAGSARAVCAAELDLLRLVATRGQDVPFAGLERLLAQGPTAPAHRVPGHRAPAPGRDTGWVDSYARQLTERMTGAASEALVQRVVEQVLGSHPDPARSPVLRRLVERQPRAEEALVKALDQRLLTGDPAWFELDLPPRVVAALDQRPGRRWILLLAQIRHIAQGPADPDGLAAALAEAYHGRYTTDLPTEVVPAVARWTPRQVDRLAAELWYLAQPLAKQLYPDLLRTREAAQLRVALLQHGHQELQRLQYAYDVLGYDGWQPATAPAATQPADQPPTDRRGLLSWRRRK
ncbi:hypothetical protein [Kitasatospora sp. NPDC097643]|uniref:hypothetical protein n=1 Tax=Kitasatospora sp. NPDC097643 TaxID=3157230 RepID=UPI0033321181